MKTNKIKDERIVQLNNKIQSEAFILIIAILALSIFIKAYMLDMGVREYLTEMLHSEFCYLIERYVHL